jgi:hypothetical protein
MVREGLGAVESGGRGAARTGTTILDKWPAGVEDATWITPNFTGAASCAAVTVETVQHGAELQFDPAAAESDGACPDAPVNAMAPFVMPGIGASLEGRQQSMEEPPSAQIF